MGGMTAFQRLVYAIAYAAFRAWGDWLDDRYLAVKEVPDAADRARARKLRDAVGGLPAPPHRDP